MIGKKGYKRRKDRQKLKCFLRMVPVNKCESENLYIRYDIEVYEIHMSWRQGH
jgi:hypothetical protein